MNDVFDSLQGVVRTDYASNGTVRHCTLNKKNEISSRCGVLVPRYGEMDKRRKNNSSISFYANGAVKRIALERQMPVETPLGSMPAELVTFYESGALKRFFPRNGQISGFWSEQDEEGLLEPISLALPFGEVRAKIVGCCFYESGAIKSLTLWPSQAIQVDTGIGILAVRQGLSFYESGAIQSLEPARATDVPTPIGILRAYDDAAVGIHGDSNSLEFDEKGDIAALTVPGTAVTVMCDDGYTTVIEPVLAIDPLDGESVIELPVRVSFLGNTVLLEVNGRHCAFDLHRSRFIAEVKRHTDTMPRCAGNCAQCRMCQS